ncbi:pentatricopeptide repeat-containing protein At1g11290, chloroplastic-like [Neltuma alba]|uniref:pentatricopeptide repeat-containing protein At1g11290, chloroplastic-like n=1 Tax=Neltuma alba TaxID=207710 RepID=UPI0010A5879B|nr:pentatricopeptide repeat-containing protein At1g11290, chloroplastic-like [Prosopis alba]
MFWSQCSPSPHFIDVPSTLVSLLLSPSLLLPHSPNISSPQSLLPPFSILNCGSSCIQFSGQGQRLWWFHLIELRSYAKKRGFLYFEFNSGLSKCREIEEAKNLFDEMLTRAPVTWNSMISGSVRNRKLMETLLELFHRMQEEGVEPREFIMVSLLNACAHGLTSTREMDS